MLVVSLVSVWYDGLRGGNGGSGGQASSINERTPVMSGGQLTVLYPQAGSCKVSGWSLLVSG